MTGTKVIPPKELLEATTGGLSVLVVAGGSTGDVLTQQSDGTYAPVTPSATSGDFVGPASSTDRAIVTFNGTTGKLGQNSAAIVTSAGAVQAASGGAMTPSLAFSTDTNTGLYRWGEDVIGVALGGANYHVFSSNGVQTTAQFLLTATIGAADVGTVRHAAGVMRVTDSSSGYGSVVADKLGSKAYTAGTLPSAATWDGYTARVTDSSVAASGNYGATVAGGGANKVRVFSDGTNWVIA